MSQWQASHAHLAQDLTANSGAKVAAQPSTRGAENSGDQSLLWFLVMLVASALCSLLFGRGRRSGWGGNGSYGNSGYGSGGYGSDSYGGGGGGGSGYGGSDGGDVGGGGGGGG